MKIFYKEIDGKHGQEWQEITDLYWFEENFVHDFDGEGGHSEEFIFKFEDDIPKDVDTILHSLIEMEVIHLRADNAALRELLGETLERIPHWQKCAVFDNPEEQCDCERSDIQFRVQQKLEE